MPESGIADFPMSPNVGLMAPTGTPPAIIETLRKAVSQALQDPDLVKRLDTLGIVSTPTSGPEQFSEVVRKDGQVLGKLVRQSGAKVD